MTVLIVFTIISMCSALELGSQIYPDTAVLHANFTDGTSLAILKSYDEQLYLCENEWCTCKKQLTLHQTQAYTEDDYFSISALSICDIECVPCSFTGTDWECNCPESSVMTQNIQCASTCPKGQQPGPSGLCEPKQNANWVKLFKPDQRMPNHDFTFHIDAKPLADTLLSTNDFVIGSNYVEILGRRHDFPDAQCLNDVCTYTVSADEDRVVFWVDKELAGTAPITRMINLHSGKKIEGSGVVNTWYRAGVAGPQKLHPSVHRQLQGIDNCSSKCMEGACLFKQDPTSCILCAPQYYEYCTEYETDVACPYFLCLAECGSGIILTDDPYRRCYRDNNHRYSRTIWDKFETYGTDHNVNEFKPEIGVLLLGGSSESYEIIDPVPAFERGLYYNGYSAASTFQGLNLGTDFNIGFWLKPFHFDGLFSVYDARSNEMILEMVRREPTNENEVTSIAWTMRTEENVSNFYATSIADKQFEAFYQLENIWWLLTLRVNADFSVDADDFAASFRIYYNNQFGGDTINLKRDYFEDSTSYFHLIGRDLSFSHFHGFIGDVIYYNWGEANFPELMVSGVEECISCEICPSTKEYFECRLTGTERTCNRNVDVRNWCPDCCEAGEVWIEGECLDCGILCYSCSTHETADNSLEAGNCDFCVEYAEFDDPPGRDCVCFENYSYDAVNKRCCEPNCRNCPGAPFVCAECFYGYLLTNKTGLDNVGLPLMGNECIQNNCFGGVPFGDNLCKCPRGYHIEGEVCDDRNICTCNSLDCTCVPIPCLPGCALCNSQHDLSRCFYCEEGYIDLAPFIADIVEAYAYCVEDCPSGFTSDDCTSDPAKELIMKYQFNYPISEFENLGAVRINLEIETDLPSGALAKNRGIYFDGVGDAFVELSFFTLNHSWTVVNWLYPMMNGTERMVFFHKEDTFIAYIEGDVMGIEILSQQVTDTGGFARTGLVTRSWQFISQEYEMVDGKSTDIRMFIDDQPMLTASVNNFQIDYDGLALLGLQIGDDFTNKFKGYYFDLSILQTSTQETYRTEVRTNEACAVIDCWGVEFNQYQSDTGSALSCSADCINGQKGCINARDCREDCKHDSEWCHLCLDYECQDCTTYDTCEAEACAENSTNFDESICICDEPEYGRDFNIDAPCAQCDPACDTCSIEGIAGCLTCTPGVRRMVDPDNLPSQCICIDGKYPDPTHADCGDCHSNCLTCFGGEAWECLDEQCANGRYQWNTSTQPDALHLCLVECPTGYITHEAPFRYCERPSLSNWQFDYFPRTNIDLDVDGMTISSCFADAPAPIYGRGLYFDGINSCLELGNINMGTEFSLQFWFRADEPDTNFTNLVSVVDAPNETEIFNIGLSDGGDSVQVTFVSTYGNTTKSTSLTAREARNYSISGQWNSLGYTSWAVKNGSDSQMRFGTEMRFSINAFRPSDVSWEYDEYMEDHHSFSHKIGFGADASAYKGHIGTINYFNFQVEEFDNIAQITTSSCPTCSSCPVEKAYTECVDDCEFDFIGTCVSTNCDDLKVPICPIDCGIGHYQEENLTCTACTEGGDSCRLVQNDRVCDDILCTSCEPLYGECNHPDSCVTFASEVDGDCACDEYYQINSVTNNCARSCHEICEGCEGPNIWQCKMCMPGYYEVPIRAPFKEGILCLTECPTSFRENGPICIRLDNRAYVFDFFRRQDFDLDVRGLELYGGSRLRSDSADPTPVYGRGLYFDGTNILQFGEFNMGQDFTFSIWFSLYRFGTLYSVNDSSGSIFVIAEAELDEQKVTGLDLNLTLGTSYVYSSSGQLSLGKDHGWSLENQWNNMAINLRSHYHTWDDAQNEFSFACEINMFMNHYGKTDTVIIANDYWSEDNENNSHIVGRNFSRNSSIDGFIGDVIYTNYAYYVQLDYVTSTYPTTPGCPSSLEASESKHYIDCVEDCEVAFGSSSQARVGSCIEDCNHDPFCADVCPIDQFMDEDNDFACTDCEDACPSCRNGVTCDGCNDIRCAGCSTYYNICDGGCKTNAFWDDRNEICVCEYEFDETTYNCCYENCLQCSDPLGPCDECAEFYFGDYCEYLCYEDQGVIIHGTTRVCACLAGWSGIQCNTPCLSSCYMCTQYDENLCTECPGNYEGDRCDRCISNWDIDFDCQQCLTQYFHESAENRNCQLRVTNGFVLMPDQLDYECFEFYSQAPPPAPRGECRKNECYGGCRDCTTTVDYRDCMACNTDAGWADPDELEKTDGQQRTCIHGCPSGYETVTANPLKCAPSTIKPLSSPQAKYDFNFPSVTYSNRGYVPEVDIAVCTDGSSGIPAKNRGVCFDGTGNGVIFIENYLLNPSFSIDIWFLLRERNGDQVCSLMHKRDLMDLRVTYGDNEWQHEMGTVIGTEGQRTIHQSSAQGVFTNMYQRLIYSYTHIDGIATDAKYYIDGGIVKYETLEDRIIIDDISKELYLGGKHVADSTRGGCSELINKCNACIYDFVMTQVPYVPLAMGRVETGVDQAFWDVEINEWVDDVGDVHECDASCIYGCVDGAACQFYFNDVCQFCYLCHDRECIACDTYPVCDVCEPSRSEEDGEGGCVCKDGYGRRDKAEKCVKCHFSCLTCIGPDEDDCSSCNEGTQMSEPAPAKCICADGTYASSYVGDCRDCHTSCFNCIGPLDTHCIECHESAFLEGFSPNKCTCYDGFYMPDGSNECFPCHPTCRNCTGGEATDCYECHHGAYITITNECFCYEGPVHEFTTETDASACEITECSPNCSSCFTYPWRCDGCLESSQMINHFCDCPDGYTYQPDTYGDPCVPDEQCHYTCETCAFENDPNVCLTCHENASVRFDDRPTWCDCDSGFYPSWTTDNCVPLPPITIFDCRTPCVTCLEMDPNYCTSCNQGAELSGTTCVCEDGYVEEPDAGHCQLVCPEFCMSCLVSDTSLCTKCVEDYVLSHYWPTVKPSPCVHYTEFCPEFCCECDLRSPGSCIACCPGYKLDTDPENSHLDICVDDIQCHPTCLTCWNSAPNNCIECHPWAHIESQQPPFGTGYCVCDPKWLETPDSSNCVPLCAPECETCSGPEDWQCLTCPHGYKLVSDAPCLCTHVCHTGCKECWGNDYNQCTECGENMNLYYGQCLCEVGYEMDPDFGCVHVGAPKYSEFIFNHCASNFHHEGVGLVGDSYETSSLYPLPVSKRGVFFNNKTYFRMTGITLGSNFAMNTWVKSHDTGYATIFSVNGDCSHQGSTVSEFSWRIANGKRSDNRRHNSQEITDWSHNASNVLLQSMDKHYKPCAWNNLAFSVQYEFENSLSTITFYSLENHEFFIRAQISSNRKFMRTSVDNEYTLGNRLSRNDEPVNSFLGFMYYYAVYSYAENDFDRSLGKRCHNCSSECGPDASCLGNCWYDELDQRGECCACDASCQTCLFNTKTCYCDNRPS